MKQATRYFVNTVIVGAACIVMHAGWAQGLRADSAGQRDPARWYQEDMTPRARLLTSQKEAGAAYREAQAECKKSGGVEQASCMREARNNLNQDLSDARRQFQAS